MTPLESAQASLLQPYLSVSTLTTPMRHGLQVSKALSFCRRLSVTDGSAKVARVLEPLEMGLTESAVEAIQQWKFKPATKNGKEVAVAVNIEINFNLAKKK
jgi:TonB family protein